MILATAELWLLPFALSANKGELHRALSKPSPDLFQLHQMLYKEGGIDVHTTRGTLIVEGRRNVPIRITDIRAIIKRKLEPAGNFTLLTPGPQSGAQQKVPIAFDLDEEYPVARTPASRTLRDEGFFGAPVFADLTVNLAKGEQQLFNIIAHTRNRDVEWTIEIAVQVDGKDRRLEIDYAGRPFRTSAPIVDKNGNIDVGAYKEVYEYVLDEGPLKSSFRRTR